MALNIKNPEAEQLANEMAALAGETKTEAIRIALLERKQRLKARHGQEYKQVRVERLLRERIWPQVPKNVFGRGMTKREKERILGYGPDGV